MEKKKIRNYQIFSVIFTFILGTLLHFTYELSGENLFVGLFSAVNESVWEHLKLLYFPMLITTIIGYFYLGKDKTNLVCSKTIGIIVSMLFIIIFFYTYTGVLGKNIDIINITSFFVAVLLGEYISYIGYALIKNSFKCNKIKSIIILLILFFCFIVFTFYTPNIGIFKAPIAGGCGIISGI